MIDVIDAGSLELVDTHHFTLDGVVHAIAVTDDKRILAAAESETLDGLRLVELVP